MPRRDESGEAGRRNEGRPNNDAHDKKAKTGAHKQSKSDPYEESPGDVMSRTLALLFPYAKDEISKGNATPRASWAPGETPLKGQALDEVIKTLKKKNRLRSLDELRALTDKTWMDPRPKGLSSKLDAACPFWRARWWTAMAAAAAQESVQLRRKNLKRLKQRNSEIEALIENLDRFVADFKPNEVAPIYTLGLDRVDYAETTPIIERAAEAHNQVAVALAALKELKAAAKREHRRLSATNRPESIIWLQTFCEAMGHLWRFLTGSNPSSSSVLFIDLVEDALTSIGVEPEHDLQSNIRAAVERVLGKPGQEGRPFWDRFDRMEEGSYPPSWLPRNMKMDENIAEWKHRGDDWKAEIRNIYFEAVAIDPAKRSVANAMLAWIYLTKDDEICSFMDSIGWTPPKGVERIGLPIFPDPADLRDLQTDFWKDELPRLIKQQRSGDSEADDRLQKLYADAGPKQRERIEDLGWRPPQSIADVETAPAPQPPAKRGARRRNVNHRENS
ncbi:hypothetical protein [Methylocapsa acidiphila]|uniref:hypothetical protein n=1 Tax=Methylocapsa acidiphila TaxID=133552 RepID=UPI000415CF7B|nr:hypothetical protein [Methylocapsa acidiphila]